MKAAMRLTAVILLATLALAGSLIMTGCEGSETGTEVEETVRELSGAGVVEKGEKIKQQIRDLNAQDIERIQEDLSRGVYGQEE